MSGNLITAKSLAKQLNDRVLTDYYYRLMLIARSIFEWSGLDDLGIDEKYIEKYLFAEGRCVLFKDDNLGYMVTGVVENGILNHYDDPATVQPIATNYTPTKSLTPGKDCVVIRNNDIMLPTSPTIQLYALKLMNLDRTIDVNVQAQKMPIIIKCSKGQMLSLKNVISQRNDNEPVIYGDKGLDTESIEVLKTEAPIVFDKLEYQKHMVWNECMTFLGINNANMDKKERLVDDEVQANNEQVEASFNVMLRAREQACKELNELFGTHISVKKRVQPTPVLNGSEGVNNSEGGVHE